MSNTRAGMSGCRGLSAAPGAAEQAVERRPSLGNVPLLLSSPKKGQTMLSMMSPTSFMDGRRLAWNSQQEFTQGRSLPRSESCPRLQGQCKSGRDPFLRMATSSSIVLFAKGTKPVNTKKETRPKEKTSAETSGNFTTPKTISGAIHNGVPPMGLALKEITRDSPKSRSFARVKPCWPGSCSTRMLVALRSPCTIGGAHEWR
mmetsp:Transcript_125132/g.389537  ORF Transcript_125132/g.389537 Transcript_125132/m.389537 type:complete len:202 (-) Transcript_125132:268-873(-)